mmetsp:Transcript_26777/g.107272  ORF Transcript_26777/g.107272 Transcript_26777/m.107272 type:complete len:243 (+) Transcript_26777:1333-2061(+)
MKVGEDSTCCEWPVPAPPVTRTVAEMRRPLVAAAAGRSVSRSIAKRADLSGPRFLDDDLRCRLPLRDEARRLVSSRWAAANSRPPPSDDPAASFAATSPPFCAPSRRRRSSTAEPAARTPLSVLSGFSKRRSESTKRMIAVDGRGSRLCTLTKMTLRYRRGCRHDGRRERTRRTVGGCGGCGPVSSSADVSPPAAATHVRSAMSRSLRECERDTRVASTRADATAKSSSELSSVRADGSIGF